MKLGFSPAEEAFRAECADWLNAQMAGEFRDIKGITTLTEKAERRKEWEQHLGAHGWGCIGWPKEWGGRGASLAQQVIFAEEYARAGVPGRVNHIGIELAGPTLLAFGTEDQKKRFLPDIAAGNTIFCQGFSEPGAGSDLASLRTQARREGDAYIVNGSKIWTSGAHEADWLFCLVKTDTTGKAQQSVSCLLIDLRSPGITIRPIRQINSEAHVCEVFFDNVLVPAENLVGQEGAGWTYAKFLLEHERTTSSFIFWIKRELARTRELGFTFLRNGRPAVEDPDWVRRLAVVAAQVEAHEWSVLRVLSEEVTDYPLSAGASVLKLVGSDLQQQVTSLQVDLLGDHALRDYGEDQHPPSIDPLWPDIVQGRTSRALMARAATIYGGSQQIQKNLIAKFALGL
jgi:alkylation response protein AidB-like acyl-CoA dehydrogenase